MRDLVALGWTLGMVFLMGSCGMAAWLMQDAVYLVFAIVFALLGVVGAYYIVVRWE